MRAYSLIKLSLIIPLMVLLFVNPIFAETEPNEELFITSVKPSIAYDSVKTTFIVHVVRLTGEGGSSVATDEENAHVMMTLTFNQDKHELQLNHKVNGDYEGTLVIPRAGKWDVTISAEVEEEDNNTHPSNILKSDNFHFTLDVQKSQPAYIPYIILGSVILLGGIWFYIKRKFKAN